MPVRCGLKDSKGYYCRWGKTGKKYYYDKNNKASRERARAKAARQGRAIEVNKALSDIKAIIIELKNEMLNVCK